MRRDLILGFCCALPFVLVCALWSESLRRPGPVVSNAASNPGWSLHDGGGEVWIEHFVQLPLGAQVPALHKVPSGAALSLWGNSTMSVLYIQSATASETYFINGSTVNVKYAHFVRFKWLWWPAVLLLLPAAYFLHRWQRDLLHDTIGRCQACGYDLRATPDRCPECGLEPVKRVNQIRH